MTEESTALVVTADEIELIKRTIANGASDSELKLYLYDCKRQGVHPLDKLLHFTKRGGKYVPVASIDLMRIRAAETNEYAGSDDAVFSGGTVQHPDEARVTVWRLVQGQRCAFTATARWSEYKPEPGSSGQGDVMWRRMPHTMLAKCAEGLALRKGFPRQLSGVYAAEEMDQANRSEVRQQEPVSISAASVVSEDNVVMPAGLDAKDLPAGVVYIEKWAPGMGTAKAFVWYSGQVGQDGLPIYKNAEQVKQWCEDGVPVRVKTKESASGKAYVNEITPAVNEAAKPTGPVPDGDLAF